uniref:Lipocalin/cytosolic fatty-acid binding domain-containing protein n=1 Tax=Ornithorhynchus anatinus TaxID=9258 RepID=F7EK68_ORNAN
QFAGAWNIIAAASNDKVFLSKKDSMKMATAIVTPAANGDLNVKFGFPKRKIESVERKQTLTPSKKPQWGRTSGRGWVDFNQKKIHVVKTDYKRYAIMYMQVERDGVTSNMLQLYSRCWGIAPGSLWGRGPRLGPGNMVGGNQHG